MLDWIVSILLFIVSLGLLICLHELGHFATAKMFNVYCHEFSIGFGPALLHKKKEGKETTFSIRAIPLGGYVSMAGDDDEPIEPGLDIPKERTIEGIKKWKKAIIISAGVVVNAVLALVIFSIKNLCFPMVNTVNEVSKANTQLVSAIEPGDQLDFITYIAGEEPPTPNPNNFINVNRLCVIDDTVTIEKDNVTTHYVLGFSLYSEKEENDLGKGLTLYVAKLNTSDDYYKDWKKSSGEEEFYIPDTSSIFEGDAEFTANFKVVGKQDLIPINLSVKGGYFDNLGITFKLDSRFAPLADRIEGTFTDFGESAIGVFKGIVMLFTPGGINNMSGIVGIFAASKNIYSTRTFAYYLYLWGYISINLAIFNLLPFPGLDGWQLLVTAIEGISKKKVPNKFKAIMNLIGMGLLIILMIAILVVDILKIPAMF